MERQAQVDRHSQLTDFAWIEQEDYVHPILNGKHNVFYQQQENSSPVPSISPRSLDNFLRRNNQYSDGGQPVTHKHDPIDNLVQGSDPRIHETGAQVDAAHLKHLGRTPNCDEDQQDPPPNSKFHRTPKEDAT